MKRQLPQYPPVQAFPYQEETLPDEWKRVPCARCKSYSYPHLADVTWGVKDDVPVMLTGRPTGLRECLSVRCMHSFEERPDGHVVG